MKNDSGGKKRKAVKLECIDNETLGNIIEVSSSDGTSVRIFIGWCRAGGLMRIIIRSEGVNM